MKKSILFLLVLTLTITTVCSFSVSAAEDSDYVFGGTLSFDLNRQVPYYGSELSQYYISANWFGASESNGWYSPVIPPDGISSSHYSYTHSAFSGNIYQAYGAWFFLPLSDSDFELVPGRDYKFSLSVMRSTGVGYLSLTSSFISFCSSIDVSSGVRPFFEPRIERYAFDYTWGDTTINVNFRPTTKLKPNFLILYLKFDSVINNPYKFSFSISNPEWASTDSYENPRPDSANKLDGKSGELGDTTGALKDAEEAAKGGKSDEEIQAEIDSAMDWDAYGFDNQLGSNASIQSFMSDLLSAFGADYMTLIFLSCCMGLGIFLIGKHITQH